jgi:hypothetical protein
MLAIDDGFWLMISAISIIALWIFKEFFYKGQKDQRLIQGDEKFKEHDIRIKILEKEFPEVKYESAGTRKALESHQNEQEKALLKLESSIIKMIENQSNISQDISVIKYALKIEEDKK